MKLPLIDNDILWGRFVIKVFFIIFCNKLFFICILVVVFNIPCFYCLFVSQRLVFHLFTLQSWSRATFCFVVFFFYFFLFYHLRFSLVIFKFSPVFLKLFSSVSYFFAIDLFNCSHLAIIPVLASPRRLSKRGKVIARVLGVQLEFREIGRSHRSRLLCGFFIWFRSLALVFRNEVKRQLFLFILIAHPAIITYFLNTFYSYITLK